MRTNRRTILLLAAAGLPAFAGDGPTGPSPDDRAISAESTTAPAPRTNERPAFAPDYPLEALPGPEFAAGVVFSLRTDDHDAPLVKHRHPQPDPFFFPDLPEDQLQFLDEYGTGLFPVWRGYLVVRRKGPYVLALTATQPFRGGLELGPVYLQIDGSAGSAVVDFPGPGLYRFLLYGAPIAANARMRDVQYTLWIREPDRPYIRRIARDDLRFRMDDFTHVPAGQPAADGDLVADAADGPEGAAPDGER